MKTKRITLDGINTVAHIETGTPIPQQPAAGEAEHTPNPSRWQADGDMISAPSGNIADCCDAETAAFIVRACNAHAGLSRAWSELAFHANALANAKTKAERDAAALKVFCAIGDAKDALPELRTLSEISAALKSAKL